MNGKEEEARRLCSFCNWVEDCTRCSLRNWDHYPWIESDKPLFDPNKCSNWINYLPQPLRFFTKLKIKILIKLGCLNG